MPHLGNYLPRVEYDVQGDGRTQLLTNVTLRFKIRDIVINSVTSYFEYDVTEGEQAFMVADRFYGDPTLDWVVLMTNRMTDPYTDWPVSRDVLERQITETYGSMAAAHQGTHHYEMVRPRRVTSDGAVIPEESFVIDETSYDALPATERRTVTNYEYEDAKNEAKRRIRVLDRRYVPALLGEAERILRED